METTLVDRIIECISAIPGIEYSDFLNLHGKKEYRRAYLVLIKLLNSTEATEEMAKLLEEYWWEFAN